MAAAVAMRTTAASEQRRHRRQHRNHHDVLQQQDADRQAPVGRVQQVLPRQFLEHHRGARQRDEQAHDRDARH
jgi:hypothetical protein